MSVGDEITTTAAGDEPLALINQLADEILGAIFLINTAKATYYNPHSTTLATAQVCSRWRAVALSYSALWSKIIDYERHPPTWIEELLRRSGSSLIDVGEDSVFKPVELQNPRAMEVLQPVFGQSSRLRTFSLKIRLAPWEFICQNLLRHPAPQLKYLNLITVCPFPDCLYPGPLFSAEAPALRSLHLQRCLIDFSSVVLSNLTELSVMDILAPPLLTGRGNNHPLKIAPTAVGWLRVLENMPSLRYLTLGDAISDNSNAKFDEALPKVHLPNLVLLTISSRFHEDSD
ncbi:hypothetical protein B0H34DRAFT_400134 [Crassisporium funariophilum]|nr:hypothetical protein B0H34DRAFT_400134 [Crassisporium funariophilum]